MNYVVKLTSTKGKRLALLSVIVPGLVFAMQGCGIPPLRCPKPGAPLPQSYLFPNNGTVGWGSVPEISDGAAAAYNDKASGTKTPDTKSPGVQMPGDKTPGDKTPGADKANPNAAKSDSAAANSSMVPAPIQLAGFVQPADALKLNAAVKSQDSGTADRSLKPVSGGTPFANFIRTASAQDLTGPGSSADVTAGAAVTPGAGAAASDASAANSGMGAAAPLPSNATSGPDFQPISMDVGINGMDNTATLPWNQFFNDPMLSSLISEALLGNQELKILAEDIQIASNEVLKWRGSYLPFVTLGGRVGVEKPSLFTPMGAVEKNVDYRPGQGFPDPLPQFMIASNVTWEIDIWRRLRNSRDAAGLRYLGTADGWNYTVTRMVSEVAENYYALLALDNQLLVLDRTISLQLQSLKTAEAMKLQARGTELGVQRFTAEVRKNQSQKLIIQQRIVEAENQINFLLGRYPQPVDRQVVDYVDLNLNALSIGVPADLLRNRSDIRQAERELGAAGLDVSIARARFYPALIVNAGVGYSAFNPKYLFSTPDALMYNLLGDLIGPLINKRAIRADYMSANARQLQALYEYQRAILNAFTEVTNHVNKVENYRTSIEIKKQQLKALTGSVDVATKLFQSARGEYLDVLLAQRDLNEARMILIDTKREQLTAVVDAYQAIGGGGVLQNANFVPPLIPADVIAPLEVVPMPMVPVAPVIVAPVTSKELAPIDIASTELSPAETMTR